MTLRTERYALSTSDIIIVQCINEHLSSLIDTLFLQCYAMLHQYLIRDQWPVES